MTISAILINLQHDLRPFAHLGDVNTEFVVTHRLHLNLFVISLTSVNIYF